MNIQDYISAIRITDNPRFNFVVPGTVVTDLTACYTAVVESRGRKFIADVNTQKVISSVANWFLRGKHGLILTGKVGTGKSVMMRAIAMLINFYSSQRTTMKIISAIDVCELARNERKTDEDIDVFNKLKTYHYVGLDDLGTEPVNVKVWGSEVSPVIDTLYSRYDNMKVTVITTNDNMDIIRKKYEDRIFDRLCEQYDRVSFDFESFRQK